MGSLDNQDNSIYAATAILRPRDLFENLDDDTNKKSEVGMAFYQLAKIYYDKADLIAAEENFVKALQCCEKIEHQATEFKILGFLIRIASEELDDEKANRYIQDAQRLIDQVSNSLPAHLSAEYFYNVGVVKNYSGKFAEARDNFELAMRRSKEENTPELLSKCLLALAINYYNRNDFEKALDYLVQLSQLLEIIRKYYLKGVMHFFLAKVYLSLGQFDRSQKNYRIANETLQGKKCWNLYGYILLGMGVNHKKQGDFDGALTYFSLAQQSADNNTFKRLSKLIDTEISEVNDSSVDIYLDRTNRMVKERTLGSIDFKHRFILLEILFLLAKNPGSYFDKEQMAQAIWKDEYNPLIHDKLIYTSVSRLRKLIEPHNDRSEKRKYIVRGKDGYTFNPLAKIRFHMESKLTNGKTIGNVEISSPV